MRLTRLLLLSTALALATAAAAAAHVTLTPPFVESGVPTDIALAVPGERPPHATVAVAATMPAGVSIVSARSPAGWTAAVDGATVTWSGGRITGRAEVAFPLRIRASVRAGTYRVATRQKYDDGAEVRWASDLSVVPAVGEVAPDQHPWPAIIASVVGVAVVLASLLVLRRLRR